MATVYRIKAEKLRGFTARLCEALGTPSEIADVEAEILVNADLRGHTSHGVYQFPNYIKGVEGKSLHSRRRSRDCKRFTVCRTRGCAKRLGPLFRSAGDATRHRQGRGNGSRRDKSGERESYWQVRRNTANKPLPQDLSAS